MDKDEENEERLRIICELSTDYAYCHKLTEDGALFPVWHVGSFDRITEYTPEELYAKGGWAALIHPEDIPGAEEYVKTLLSGREASFTARIVTKSGAVRWIKDNGRPWIDKESGNIIGTFGAAKDITEQKQTKEQRETEKNFLKTLIDALPDYIYLKDADRRFIILNTANAAALGVPDPDDAIGKKDGDFYPAFLADVFEADDRRVIESGIPIIDKEEHIETARGLRQWLLTTKIPLRGKSGAVTGLAGIGKNVTERVELENKLRESQKAFSQAFYHMPVLLAISTIDEGIYLEVNDELCRVSGYTREELIGRKSVETGLTTKDERKRVTGRLKKEGSVHMMDSVLYKKDGTVIDCLYSGVVIQFGGEARFLSMLIDITGRKQTEEELRKLIELKELLMKELQHRVKNSLNLTASLVAMGASEISDDRAIRVFDNIKNRISSIAAIYESLYQTGEAESVLLEDYIENLTRTLFDTYVNDPERIRLTTNLHGIYLDTKRAISLGLIVNELITNSLKYAFPDAKKGEIRIGLEEDNGSVILTVSDNGAGLPPDFNPQSATTYGLLIVRTLAEELGAELTVSGSGGVKVSLVFRK